MKSFFQEKEKILLRIRAHRDAGCDRRHCANEISDFNSEANDLGTLRKFNNISTTLIELGKKK